MWSMLLSDLAILDPASQPGLRLAGISRPAAWTNIPRAKVCPADTAIQTTWRDQFLRGQSGISDFTFHIFVRLTHSPMLETEEGHDSPELSTELSAPTFISLSKRDSRDLTSANFRQFSAEESGRF
jgi:hypothetical protein